MGKELVNFITWAASRVHPFCNLQSRARTHAVFVIGLYELKSIWISNHLNLMEVITEMRSTH
jgi:hypothetical protein